jgi:hypothetical protein
VLRHEGFLPRERLSGGWVPPGPFLPGRPARSMQATMLCGRSNPWPARRLPSQGPHDLAGTGSKHRPFDESDATARSGDAGYPMRRYRPTLRAVPRPRPRWRTAAWRV